jgi:uncharacterized protein (DUF58 family)
LLRATARRLRVLATYDFLPALSARIRRALYNPLGILVLAALVALLCGRFLHPQGFALGGAILAVLALGIAWPWLSLRGVRGSIAFERARAGEGEPVDVCLTLRNRWPWSAWGLAVHCGFTRQTGAPEAAIASAPRRRAVRYRWSFVPAGRGVYPLVAPRLTTGFPFGLWENQSRLTVETTLIVWPRTFPVGPLPRVSGDRLPEGNVARNQVGSNGDVLGVRPYRRGDSPRRIHWGQSARHDRLIVCELQSNARPVVQLVLDTDPRVHSGSGPDGSREWAIRIAASLARGWLEAGAQVGACWNGQVIPPASGTRQLQQLLDALARLPEQTGPALAETLRHPACRDFRDGVQVIITTDLRSNERQGLSPPTRWVVLRSAAFGEGSTAPARPAEQPWLWIDSAERIPALLRGGWKEARHGT